MIQNVFDTFLTRYQSERNPAPATIRTLRSIIPKFLEYCNGKGIADYANSITQDCIISYLNSLPIRTSSRKLHLRVITQFLEAAYNLKLAIPYKGPHDIPKAINKGFTPGEIRMFEQASKLYSDVEWLLFNWMRTRPVRIEELSRMKVKDIDLVNEEYTVYKSKNGTTRTPWLPGIWEKDPPDVKKHFMMRLSGYLETKTPEDLVFPFAIRTLHNMVERLYNLAGVPRNGRNSHAFRHYAIKYMMIHGVPDITVAYFAGNSPEIIRKKYCTSFGKDDISYSIQKAKKI